VTIESMGVTPLLLPKSGTCSKSMKGNYPYKRVVSRGQILFRTEGKGLGYAIEQLVAQEFN